MHEPALTDDTLAFLAAHEPRRGICLFAFQLAPERHVPRCTPLYPAVPRCTPLYSAVLLFVVFTRCSERAAQYRLPALMPAYSARRRTTPTPSTGGAAGLVIIIIIIIIIIRVFIIVMVRWEAGQALGAKLVLDTASAFAAAGALMTQRLD